MRVGSAATLLRWTAASSPHSSPETDRIELHQDTAGETSSFHDILDQQTRLISFRVSESQYERLRVLSSWHGAKSISRFVRWTITQVISNGERTILDLLGMPVKTAGLQREEPREELAPEPASLDRERLEEQVSEAIRRLSEKIDGIDRELHQWRSREHPQEPSKDRGSESNDEREED